LGPRFILLATFFNVLFRLSARVLRKLVVVSHKIDDAIEVKLSANA